LPIIAAILIFRPRGDDDDRAKHPFVLSLSKHCLASSSSPKEQPFDKLRANGLEQFMDLGLTGKVAIVTGATANIGRAIALDLASEGAVLVAVGRDEAAGAKLIDLARERGASDAVFVKADLLDHAAPARIIAAAEALGPIAVLINNVGGNASAGHFAESDPDGWEDDLDINLKTTLRMTRAVLPGMIERKAGRIVNIGSTAGIVGDYTLPIYSTAKAAVHGFTKILAKEVGQHGITVNCVAPYATMARDPEAFSAGSRFNPERGFFQELFAGASAEDAAKRPRKTVLAAPMAQPEDVSGLVVFLASARAGFITGQVYPVDGGSLL
jgi:2-hydroxycyclohexanecarboxyl-CoA dehydrogenase